ncbi:hypothetical protein EOM82_02215 [bacterium]|nr:hypothetical protein [bacterium]
MSKEIIRPKLNENGYMAVEKFYGNEKMEYHFRFMETILKDEDDKPVESFSERKVLEFLANSYSHSCLTLFEYMEKYEHANTYSTMDDCSFRFFPAMFCFRHYLELKLKYLYIWYTNNCFNTNSHNLEDLLKELRNNGFQSDVFDKPIAWINKYEKADPLSKGDDAYFRYYINNKLICNDNVDITMFNYKLANELIANIEYQTAMLINKL